MKMNEQTGQRLQNNNRLTFKAASDCSAALCVLQEVCNIKTGEYHFPEIQKLGHVVAKQIIFASTAQARKAEAILQEQFEG